MRLEGLLHGFAVSFERNVVEVGRGKCGARVLDLGWVAGLDGWGRWMDGWGERVDRRGVGEERVEGKGCRVWDSHGCILDDLRRVVVERDISRVLA